MKKILFLLSVVLLSFPGFTKDLGVSWLVTGNSKLDCKKISFGYKNARIVLENGEKMTILINLINSYSLNGQVFTKLPLYSNGEPTGRMVFMELINTYGIFSLYKLGVRDFRSSNHHDKLYRYFLYNGDKLDLAFDEQTLPDIGVHFGLANSYK